MSTESGDLPPLKKALVAIQQLKAQVRDLTGGPVAIVGTGLRLPGGVRDLTGYWDLLEAGVDAVREVPVDRWDPDRFELATREASFLDDVASFDASFFGISPREALEMDPAQRLLLEVSWEALENAAIPPDSLERSATGVYVGLGLSDYARRHFLGPDPTRMTAYSGTGSFLSVAAGRISYTLGLSGPAMTVDTACSSSLVSVHLAVDALRRGEIDVALAGGANLLLSPEPSVYFSKLGALSADGRCKTFSARADGYGRGEGAGIVVLKRLADAIADGDPILAVVRGSAVNQDGRSNGLTAPSGRAQREVVQAALRNAGLAPEAIGYIEAHGTGTPLGDPIEMDALKTVFGASGRVVRVGSAKTNFGHLETAAGVTGLLKLALCVERGVIPPHLHLDELNPRIRLEGTGLEIPTSSVSWDEDERVGGVSSFGLSGTNAHILVGRAPAREVEPPVQRPIEVVTLSARSDAQLRETARRWAAAIPDAAIADVAATSLAGRARLPHRLAVVASSAPSAAERLLAFADREPTLGVASAVAATGSAAPGVTFLFTGQGAQHPGMGRALYATEPAFREALDRCFAALDPHLERPLREVMWGEGDDVHDTRWTQPALFALEVALAELWRRRGVEPDAVIGHSIGELSAACVAGAVSLEDAARLVVERGRLMSELPRSGAMVAIFASEADVRAALEEHAADAGIAGLNGPSEVVVSGREAAVEAVAVAFEGRGVRVRRLTVSHAFHSVLMEPMLAAFEQVARSVRFETPRIPVISNLDGQPVGDRYADPTYWVRHVRQAVRFSDGLQTLLDQGHRLFLELGPRPVLSGMGRRIADSDDVSFVGSLHPDREDTEQLAEAAGTLWAHGADVAIDGGGTRLRLPTTPFEGERYWLELPEAGSADPYGDWVLETVWRAAPVERGETWGNWVVLGDPALAEALSARGAEVHTEFVPDATGVVVAPTSGSAADIAWQAAEVAQRLAVDRGFVKLWFVGDTASRPETAVLRGVGRVLGLEHPDRWGGFVDVVSGNAGDAVDAILADDGEDLVRIGDGSRRVARLVRSRRALAGDPLTLDPERAVLVTGGFGALGGQVARWLADQGARHLVLVGRSGASSAEAIRMVAELRERGLTIDEVRADVADPADIGRIFGTAAVQGIVHCAGGSADALLLQQDRESFDRVLHSKVQGALNLHAAAPEDLRFFVLFGSAAGLLGVPGQANYAAANAYLDAFAEWRRAQGKPATSIAWGPWGGQGMAEALGADVEARWAREGIHLLDPRDALNVLGRVAVGGQASVLVAPFDWSLWRRTRTGPGNLAAELATAVAPAAAAPLPTVALVEELRSAPAGARRKMLVDHVQQVVSSVLGMGAGQRIPPREGYFDAGMDSLMAMDLRERLQASIGQPLSATIAFDHPTVDQTARHVLALLDLSEDGAVAAPVRDAVATHEAVAIVGAACRFPGSANDLDGFWRVIEGGLDAIVEVPRDRYDVDRYFDPEPGTPGRTYCRYGGFIDGIDLFDPQHFGISPREAESLDPQQRLLLECTWHALEDAGTPPRALAESRTGVYVGIGQSEYWHRFDPTSGATDAYAGTGNETSFAAGRVSYVLGLRGPAMSINTACSSSLVTVHMAVQALRDGQCDVAVAGGVNAIVGPENTLWMSMLKALAPDGRCKPFDSAADGYVRSEGCGMVVLKRLSDAQRDGDRIYAVVRGSAINHDGASSGLTVPNGQAQQQVLRDALADAGVQPHEVGLVECHGTGTSLGDPIEVRALGAVLAEGRGPDAPLFLGAVKSNIGHLEAGAGIAGLLKAVLVLQRRVVPPVVHFATANPSLPLGEFPALRIPTRATPHRARIAGVSSFGISGTNAHIVLEEAPDAPEVDRTSARPASLVTWSSRTADGLAAQAAALAEHLDAHDVALADLAFALNTGRSGLRHRAALVATDLASARAQLDRPPLVHDAATDDPRVVFLCTGAGPQTWNMGRALYDVDPVFRAALDEAAAAADEVLDRPLLSILFPATGEPPELHDLAYTQPAMFALEWAMAQLWRSWGVEPDAVVGHSTGQYIAACLAGVVDLPTGIRLMATRARLMSSQPRIGSMVAVFAAADVVRGWLEGHEDAASIAAINGPAETVISGRSDVVDPLADRIEASGVEVRRLRISHAAHSPLMDPILDEFEQVISTFELRPPRIPLIENVHGRVAGDELLDPRYWREHMRQGVQFEAGTRTLADLGFRVFLELGNHPVLSGAAARTLEDVPDALFVPSLRRNTDDWATLLEAAGRLWARGVDVDWPAFHQQQPGTRIGLPGTVFQRKRHWVERADRATTAVIGQDWTYGIRWDEVRPNVEAFGSRSDKPLVVLADAGGLGERLAARQQRRCVVVKPGVGMSLAHDGDRWTVDPANPQHFEALLAEVGPGAVVCLWSLDTPADGDPTDAAAPAVQAALHLVQAASRQGNPKLWWITRGAASVRGEAPALNQAPVLGLANVAALELPDLPIVRVDLDPADDDALVHLELVLNTGLTEDQVAIRGGRHLARRLARVPAEGDTAPPIRGDGTYLVTGGLGALGLRIARWLGTQGAGRVVLTSRSAPSDELQAEADGRGWVIARGDVGARADVDRILAEVGPVAGVFHAAGVVDDGSLLTLDWSRFPAVWRAKLEGAYNLHEALPDAELFVLFSSAASMIGSAGQANYAAANAWMDALAHTRRAAGHHALSLCWGPWGDAGLATESSRQWSAGGVRPLAPGRAIQVMAQLLGSDEAEVAVVDLDWVAWPRSLQRVPALVSGLVQVEHVEEAAGSGLVATLKRAGAAQRGELLADALAVEVGGILGLEPAEIDRRLGFFDAGMDSLMAVELANRLKARLETRLPATVAFDHPTVEALRDHLLDVLELGAAEVSAPTERRIALDEPVAVIGISCRMPGGANDPESFWELLRSGEDPMTEVPLERWDLSEYYDPEPGRPGKMYVREAGWVDQDLVEGFDAEFFGISPREAASMDPQQRMLLEVSYEALERAGVATAALQRSRTGVYVGVGDSGYLQRFQECGGPLYADQYAGTGNLSAFVSGRVAYSLGVHGPNLALNTACSSSLVALHLAAQALRTGDCELALAGGVHLMLSPENFVYVSQIKALSPGGRCKTFDASADGYGRAEGCGMLALKRLSDAQRDGDPILAVIRGTACGHDGPSSGLTVPYGPAQVQVLSDAVARSGIDPADVSYIEAHGTGTVLGDPIEVHAIEEVYCQGRAGDNPLHLGAVKSNVGHMEVAAGAASLVKMVLALQHREIPPHLHFHEPNPDLELEAGGMVVDTVPTPWSTPSGVLRAGISGFGLAGTNVHLVIEEAPAPAPQAPSSGDDRPAHVLLLSARSEGALRTLAARYGELLASGASLADVAFSAATTRNTFEKRLALTATDAQQAGARLASYVVHGEAPLVATATASGRAPKVAFLFSGQGAQYPGMGRQLYDTFAVYRQVIDQCAAVLDGLLPRPLLEVLHADDGDEAIHDTTYTQPCLFAHEVALAALWRSWGVEPAVVAGHSIGQLSAACVAGVFSLQDGLRLVAERGRLMGELPREGSMLAVFAEEDVVGPYLGPDVGIAAINNPGEVVLSGRTEAVLGVAEALRAQGIDSRPLKVSHAFHSPLMDPMLDAFEAAAATVTFSAPRVPVLCNLTGKLASAETLADPAYWRSLVRSPVRFADDLRTLEDEGYEVFVEVGPHTALLGMGRRTLPGRHLAWLESLKRGEDAFEHLLPSLGSLWTRGVAVDWRAFDAPYVRRRIQLPTYAWQRRRCWLDKEEWPWKKDSEARWLVQVDWAPAAQSESLPAARWAVLGSEALAAGLRARGSTVVSLDDAPEHVLWVAPSGEGPDPAVAAVGLLELVHDLAARGLEVPLTAVTRGAVAAGGPPTDPLQATVWGLMRVVRLEAPHLDAVVVDLDVDDDGALDAILAADREPQVAVRGGERHVARLERAAFGTRSVPLSADGAYLVTGGLGGLGLEVARWLASHGAGHLVLTGRSAPKPAAEGVIEELRAEGIDVVVARGDVGLAGDVTRIVAEIRERGTPLLGVIHAAGVLADASLARLDRAAFETVFGPKVHGTRHLIEATATDPLDFLVLFSGGASLMGSPGQGNYAAANAYLDAMAAWARGQGRPVTAINWGAWAQVGMAARLGDKHADRQAAEGIHRIPLARGLDVLGRLLGHPEPQVGVLDVEWDRFVATFHQGNRPRFLERLASESVTGAAASHTPVGEALAPPTASGLPPLLDALQGRPPAEWRPVVSDFVHGEAVRVLQFDRDRQLDREQPLLDVGLDSLLAVELKNALMDGGVDVPVARVMTGPSIEQVTQLVLNVLEELGPVEAAAPTEAVEAGAPINAWVAGPRTARAEAETAVFNPVATHIGAFVIGIAASVGLYMLTAMFVGYEQDLSGDVESAQAPRAPVKQITGEDDDLEVVGQEAPAPAPKAEPKAGKAKGKTKTKSKTKSKAQDAGDEL